MLTNTLLLHVEWSHAFNISMYYMYYYKIMYVYMYSTWYIRLQGSGDAHYHHYGAEVGWDGQSNMIVCVCVWGGGGGGVETSCILVYQQKR